MRQIILDTETTGISHEEGHRIIEIGCIELVERRFTGRTFHVYINPEREVDKGAFQVHGISNEFLQDKPRFATIAADFIDFIKEAELVIHNAPFDVGFLNAELARLDSTSRLEQMCQITDTLEIARAKHPGQRNSLDALCKRYDVDNTRRRFHGALLDAELLGWVYLALTGGQRTLFLEAEDELTTKQHDAAQTHSKITSQVATKVVLPNQAEQEAHDKFVALVAEQAKVNLWQD